MLTQQILDDVLARATLLDAAGGLPPGTIAELVADVFSRRAVAVPDKGSPEWKRLLNEWYEVAWPAALAVAMSGAQFTSSDIWNELHRRGLKDPPHRGWMLQLCRRLTREGHATTVPNKRARGGPKCRNGMVNVYRGIARE